MRNVSSLRMMTAVWLALVLLAGCWSSKEENPAPDAAQGGAAGTAVDPGTLGPPRIEMPDPAGSSMPPASSQPPLGSPLEPSGADPSRLRANPLRPDAPPPASKGGNPLWGESHAPTPPPAGDPFQAGANRPPEIAPTEPTPPLVPPGNSPADSSLPPIDTPRPPVRATLPPIDAPVVPPTDSTRPPTMAPPSRGVEQPITVPAGASSRGPEKAPFDPIKENGPIFEGWSTPKLVIVATGREDGYMEPCGCAGLDRMKGGLSRRHTMIESLRKQGWPVICVDVGELSKGYGLQTEMKFRVTVEAMRQIGYDAIGFGRNDLRLPAAELVAAAAAPSPFLSANVGLLGFDAQVTARSRIIDRNGIKVGVTSVLGKSLHAEINNQEIELADPAEAITQVLPELRRTCNLLILLAFATKEESIELARRFPDFGIVVTAGGPSEPPATPERIEGTQSLLIEVGEKGMDAIVMGLYDDPKRPLRYQRVPLDSRFTASPDMKRLMAAYQDQLRGAGLAGLAIKPVIHPQADSNRGFVGSAKCKDCHEESYAVWQKSGHAKAWETLKTADPPRDADPECISCHVVGWHPTKYFPYKTGFLSEAETPGLMDVGCESCHGPGEAHVAAESGGDTALQEKMQKTVVVTKAESRDDHAKWCQNCHDLDNSPEFNFETYWPQVEHYETK